jgi:predicted HicB family RNase H-like nuclease
MLPLFVEDLTPVIKRAKPDKVQSAMRLPTDLHRKITRIAASKRLSVNQAVVQAVDEYVRREEKKQ